jgi:hypothetical protein
VIFSNLISKNNPDLGLNLYNSRLNLKDMPILFKSEIQFLQGQKQISKFYEYKLKSIIKKKISNLIDKEIP